MAGPYNRTSDAPASNEANKECTRCGGRALYWPNSIIPGDPRAPRGSNRAVAHYQPAWTCVNCGFVEPRERRVPRRTVDALAKAPNDGDTRTPTEPR